MRCPSLWLASIEGQGGTVCRNSATENTLVSFCMSFSAPDWVDVAVEKGIGVGNDIVVSDRKGNNYSNISVIPASNESIDVDGFIHSLLFYPPCHLVVGDTNGCITFFNSATDSVVGKFDIGKSTLHMIEDGVNSFVFSVWSGNCKKLVKCEFEIGSTCRVREVYSISLPETNLFVVKIKENEYIGTTSTYNSSNHGLYLTDTENTKSTRLEFCEDTHTSRWSRVVHSRANLDIIYLTTARASGFKVKKLNFRKREVVFNFEKHSKECSGLILHENSVGEEICVVGCDDAKLYFYNSNTHGCDKIITTKYLTMKIRIFKDSFFFVCATSGFMSLIHFKEGMTETMLFEGNVTQRGNVYGLVIFEENSNGLRFATAGEDKNLRIHEMKFVVSKTDIDEEDRIEYTILNCFKQVSISSKNDSFKIGKIFFLL